ncbi:MAG: D-alanine--D-alanine ligase [Erysipelotrichaceae bacterium]|nr:D-alanine--D-alanine ligase [Erysipelotrichaceae bacterium]MDY3934263.1 D-alanine--D-alanine ligase [Bacilli bacterium]
MKLKIGVIFGGKSIEHEMSIITALQAMDNIDTDKYEVIPIYITKDLVWYSSGCLRYIDSFNNFNLIEKYATKVNLINKKGRYILQTAGLIKRELTELHLVIPMVHGKGTEDGTIQGYLQMVGIPYVSNNIYSSVICQDKVFTKQLLEHNDIPTIKYVWFFDNEYNKNKEELFKKIDKLEYPLIIKPATLGSSIGIVSVKRKEQLDTAINEVLKYDRKIIVEEQIENVLEYNISMLKTNDKLYISSIEEIETKLEYRDYVDKCNLENYLNGNIVRTTPAKISEKMSEEIIELGKKTINFLNNTGLSRIDFLYDSKKKKLYVDEINSIPSCFSHHLWEEANISYKELFTIMINDTIKNINKDSEMITTMDMDVLKDLKNSDIKEFK